MKLSTRSTYGMRALVELGLASGHDPLSAAAIAKRQGLSVAYLEQLLHRLKCCGFIASVRGPRGGYVLAKDPQHITMAEVVQALDGSVSTHPQSGEGVLRISSNGKRVNGSKGDKQTAHRHAQRITEAVWHCVHERLTQSLSEVSLQDLCDAVGVEADAPLDHRYVFHI